LKFNGGTDQIGERFASHTKKREPLTAQDQTMEKRSMVDNPLLALAESYYAVAKDLERNAHEQLAIAGRLNRYGDQLCEQNMRETKPDSAGSDNGEVGP